MLQHLKAWRFRLPLLFVVTLFVLGTANTAQASPCPFGIYPNPLALVSFTGTFTYYDSGFQDALVQQNFCLFFADQANFAYALSAYPTVGLPTPLDEWFIYDNGALLPFLPYFETGWINYFAIDVTSGDVTADTGFTTLTVIQT
jgi:hypothetical protein